MRPLLLLLVLPLLLVTLLLLPRRAFASFHTLEEMQGSKGGDAENVAEDIDANAGLRFRYLNSTNLTMDWETSCTGFRPVCRIFDLLDNGEGSQADATIKTGTRKSKKGKKTKTKKSKATLSPPTSGTLLLQSLQTLLKFPDQKVEQLTEGTLLVVDRALGNILRGENDDKRTTRALHHLWNGPESDHSHGMTFVGDGHVRHYHHYQFKSSTEDDDGDDSQRKKKSKELSAEDAAKAEAEAEARSVVRFQEERLYVIRSLRAAIAHKRLVHGHTLNDIRSLFQAADTNGDGVLDCEEITDMMKHLDIPFGTSRAKNDFAHVLTNGGTHGLLLAELTEIVAAHHHGGTADLIDRHESGEDLMQVTGEEAMSMKRKALLALGEVDQ